MDYNKEIDFIINKMKGYSFPIYFIRDTPVTIKDVSKQCGINESLMSRLLMPLIALNLIKLKDDKVIITNLGKYFTEKYRDSLLPQIYFHANEGIPTWLKFHKAIKEKTPNIKRKEFSGNPFIEHSFNERKAHLFIEMMHSISSKIDLGEIISLYPELQSSCFVDVGGGLGTLTFNLLLKFPKTSGIIFDLPHLRKNCEEMINTYKLSNRCEFISGDFFDSLPLKGQHYILSRVLHDWNDSECNLILTNIRKRMNASSKLFIIEKPLPDYEDINIESIDSLLSDLNVWCMCDGRERTVFEINKLLNENGLAIIKKIVLKSSKKSVCFVVMLKSDLTGCDI